MYEDDIYNSKCSSAVLNQDLHSLLLEQGVCENQSSESSDSSLFVTIVPRRFRLCATNEAFVTKLRLYLNIPINQLLSKEKCICSNSPQLTLRHALNCSKLITYRSSLHDAVRDTVFNMAQTARISCIKEPLLKETLFLNNFGSDERGDVYCDWIDNSEAAVEFVSCNVANDTLVRRRKPNYVSAIEFKAKEKQSRQLNLKLKKNNQDNFGIKTIDGASSAALSSDVLFNSSDSYYIFNLDFKNAFNSVSRSSILPLLRKHFPEVEPFFYSFYGKSSTLVYENFDLLSFSGVRQGDPLGPFFFCLTIHLLMCELKEKFPEIDIVAYLDDIPVVAPITILKQIATFIQQRYEDIGLSLNISKFTKPHFLCLNFGGVEFHKSSYLCKAAFIGGGKNFIYEFVNRFPEKIDLIENCGSSYLNSLQQEIETLSPNIWSKCFPSDIVELPPRSLLSLPLTFTKLQKTILKVLENLDYISVVTLSHILNCKYFITYRSIVHDSVRDQLYAICKSFNIEAFIEPLVRKLSSDQTDDSFGKRRADLVAPGIDGVLNVVDVVSVDVCKNSASRLVYSADSPLSNAEKKKKKYEEPLAQLGRVEHVKYQFVPFAISLFGNIGPSGLHFFENFKKCY
ncbi:hypothetical protein P9112_012909 [Eukaryota sp. TZLM1-RC]